MSDISELKARVEELEREKLQKHVRELEAELRKKQDKQKKIVLRRIDLALAAALLIIMCVCGIAYLLRDEVSSLATRIGLPGAPTSTSSFDSVPEEAKKSTYAGWRMRQRILFPRWKTEMPICW